MSALEIFVPDCDANTTRVALLELDAFDIGVERGVNVGMVNKESQVLQSMSI